MRALTGRELATQRLLEAVKISTAGDIQRAAMFLERAHEVRAGCRGQRTQSRTSQDNASKRKAAQQDNPLTW